MQIADGSITDAKIVELSANRITTGTLSVERLIIVGSEQSIVYTINQANGTAQLSQTTIDGGALTQRSISADRIVAGAITANEIAAATILANNIAAGAITTEKLAAEAVDASKIKAGSITTSLVAANFGVALIPKMPIFSYYDIKALKIANPIPLRELDLIWSGKRMLSAAALQFKNYLIDKDMTFIG